MSSCQFRIAEVPKNTGFDPAISVSCQFRHGVNGKCAGGDGKITHPHVFPACAMAETADRHAHRPSPAAVRPISAMAVSLDNPTGRQKQADMWFEIPTLSQVVTEPHRRVSHFGPKMACLDVIRG